MKTIQINTYQFNELIETAKQNAINEYQDINVRYEWWDSVYMDAENVGLKITSFDLDRNRHAEGEFIQDADFCAYKILSEHGKDCETYRTAARYIENRDKLDIDNQNKELEELDSQFLHDILGDYSMQLQKESEYLQSDEAIIEAIQANEYEFLESGKKY